MVADSQSGNELSFLQSTYLILGLSICTFVKYVGTCDLCHRQKENYKWTISVPCSFFDTSGHLVIKLLSNTIVRFHFFNTWRQAVWKRGVDSVGCKLGKGMAETNCTCAGLIILTSAEQDLRSGRCACVGREGWTVGLEPGNEAISFGCETGCDICIRGVGDDVTGRNLVGLVRYVGDVKETSVVLRQPNKQKWKKSQVKFLAINSIPLILHQKPKRRGSKVGSPNATTNFSLIPPSLYI